MILPNHNNSFSERGRSASSLITSHPAWTVKRVLFLSLLALTLSFPSSAMGQPATRRVLILTGSDPISPVSQFSPGNSVNPARPFARPR
jgi:hypothetical protein